MQMGFVIAKMQSIFANKTENFSCGKMDENYPKMYVSAAENYSKTLLERFSFR
jgi:hypothetical protein